MTGLMLSSVSSVSWPSVERRQEGFLFTIEGNLVGRLIPCHTWRVGDSPVAMPGVYWGPLAHLYQCRYQVQDNDGACVAELQGPDRVSEPYAWVRDAEGRELASLAADLRFPSGWRNTLTGWRITLLPGWRTTVHLLRFVLFSDGATVGSMDAKMKRVFESDAGEVALSITKVSRRRFTLSPRSALPPPLVDTFWWFGLMAAVCRGRNPLYPAVAKYPPAPGQGWWI